jgi:hypothetical protein
MGQLRSDANAHYRLNQLDKSLAAYHELAMLAGEGELVPTFQTTGLAGEAVVYDRLVQQNKDHFRRQNKEDPRRSEVKRRLTDLAPAEKQDLIRDDYLKQEVKKLLASPEYLNQ